ncbi:methionyl-tRNA formyltransferase [Clostridium sp. JN-9]|uniref:methionyl-tRNA formyltransferase n=1 Tax=Clostridium sp. JN-9 TaxID=2507159 RepID=UPI000FFE2A62|nr:methionyl-tRNA formyltransferase [Clostridium sp. JN-9]QAT40145.1 methionyl-tRNA formyltransferase [Clostridium sp. JN-9]
MNLIFMGTPEFAVPSLKLLIEKFGVKAIFTQPDRPRGRGNKITMSPVKKIALENNIPVIQPVKLKNDTESIEYIKKLNPDFIIVVAFGQILPKEVLDIPKYGCINLHASLLPKYRGAAPINWAIIKGEKFTGNTTMFMDEGLDTGDMLLKSEFPISEEMDFGELHDILMNDGAKLLEDTINGLVNNTIVREKQQGNCPFYAKMLNKSIAYINWKEDNINIHNLIRGLSSSPVAYTKYNGDIMKIYKSEIIDKDVNGTPGKILEIDKAGIKVICGTGLLNINIIQFPGGKPLTVEEYLRGHNLNSGIILGE